MKFDFLVNWYRDDVPPDIVSFDLEGVDSQDRMTRLLEQRKTFYEDDLLRHLGRRGPCGGVYLDVGANIGNHAVFFGKFLAGQPPEPACQAEDLVGQQGAFELFGRG